MKSPTFNIQRRAHQKNVIPVPIGNEYAHLWEAPFPLPPPPLLGQPPEPGTKSDSLPQ